MLNTGIRAGEALGLLNSDIDIENRVMHLNRGVKEISKRDGVTAEKGREITEKYYVKKDTAYLSGTNANNRLIITKSGYNEIRYEHSYW